MAQTDEIKGFFEVFSPRWGHTDRYSFYMTRDTFKVEQNVKSALCKLDENREAVWTGYNQNTDNPVLAILRDEASFAPAILPEALEWCLLRWHDRESDEAEIRSALDQLFAWVDQTARGKPSSEFWSRYF